MSLSWKEQLQNSFSCPRELLDYLELEKEDFATQAVDKFKFLVPRFFAQLMTKSDPTCPLLRQVLPIKDEVALVQKNGVADPLEEISFMKEGAMMQKFSSRVLFLTSAHCAIHCRYCFRRNFPYKENSSSLKVLIEQIKFLHKTPEIFEVILSGGDPLTLTNCSLRKLLKAVEQVPTLEILRFHSRLPVVLPDRIDDEFLEILSQFSKKCVFVLHINHPKEISSLLLQKVQSLRFLGVDVLNQAVLLNGINDNLPTQHELWKSLALGGIKAYYLHQLDPVEGGMHFFVEPQKGKELIASLRSKLPGYMIPLYVQEIPKACSKVPFNA